MGEGATEVARTFHDCLLDSVSDPGHKISERRPVGGADSVAPGSPGTYAHAATSADHSCTGRVMVDESSGFTDSISLTESLSPVIATETASWPRTGASVRENKFDGVTNRARCHGRMLRVRHAALGPRFRTSPTAGPAAEPPLTVEEVADLNSRDPPIGCKGLDRSHGQVNVGV